MAAKKPTPKKKPNIFEARRMMIDQMSGWEEKKAKGKKPTKGKK